MKSTAKKDCIFIIDDNPENIMLLQEMLSDLNYTLRVAVRGSTAIESILEDQPDLILLDLKMPDMNGYEVCEKLRNNQITKDIPIIFISALDEIKAKVKALNAGGNDYITKPFQPEEVFARIQTHLYIRKMQKKLESNNIELSQEIIERKQAEMLILKSEERYSSIINDVLETSNVGVFLLDKEFRVVWINKAIETYFGLKRDEIIGKNNKQLICDEIYKFFEDGNEFKRTVLGTYEKNISEESFVCHVLPDGDRRERWLEHWSKPISSGLYKGGRVEQYTDISKRKQAEEALMQSEKMKAMGIMTSGVAHEFNNILAVISSNAQLLEETNKSNKELMNSLATICRMTDDGAVIVDRMYDFTNVLKDTSHYKHVDLNDLIEQVIGFTMPRWKEMAQAAGVKYQIDLKGVKALPPVLGNPSELREVILNIVNNALDAMPGGGTITVTTRCIRSDESGIESKKEKTSKLPDRRAGGQTQNSELKSYFVEIAFKDNGKGMSEDVKKSIFDPYFTTRSPEGTGLGMSVSYGIVKRHDGKIDVESEPDKGSTITLSLPVSGKSTSQNTMPKQIGEIKEKNLNILIVDDNEEICESLGKLIVEEGQNVCTVTSGAEAVKLIKKRKFDLILCDLVMPDVNGLDVVNSLQTMNKPPKVGLITGWKYEMEDAEKDGLKVDFIARKPFNLSKLRKYINDLWI